MGTESLAITMLSLVTANTAFVVPATPLRAPSSIVMQEAAAAVEEPPPPFNGVTFAKTLPGITGPLDFFDPLGFCTDASEGKIRFYREVELKHGRVAMFASLGFLVGEQFHPLFGGNIDVPSYIAFQETPLQTFWPAVMLLLSVPEVFSVQSFNEPDSKGDKFWTVKKNYWQPGFDPLGLKPKDPKEWTDMQNKELNNGRLAMIAAAGIIAQELATGQKLF